MRAALRLLALLLLLLPAAASAEGGERILSFVSDVTVRRDGDLDVTETIRLVSEGTEIKRGIQRDFPTRYADRLGQWTRTGFSVLSVARDGHDEPYTLIGLSNGVRVRIGDADTLLPPGAHLYVIRYRTTRQIAYGADSDELYWNATGTGWTFPIDSAEARITLPSPSPIGERAFYTGPQGSTARDAAVAEERPGFIVFRTTRPLPRENGLTVAVSFPKDVVAAPGLFRRAGWWLRDWGPLSAGVAALALVVAFYVYLWLTVGRGPRAGPVVPIFAPPDGLSAAAVRYIAEMGLDNRAFTAAMVELGVRGRLRIRKEGGGWFSRGTTTLEKTDGGAAVLPAPEAAMLADLFSDGPEIVLKQENNATLRKARASLDKGLETAYCGPMFETHVDYGVYGLLAVAGAVLGTAAVAIVTGGAPSPLAALFKPIAGLGALFVAVRLHIGSKRLTGGARSGRWVLAAICALGGGLATFNVVVDALEQGHWPVLIPLVALPLAFSAFRWMYAPTVAGRAVMDRIAGFKQYLGIAEEARLDTMHPPEKTPELFERYLPYAIALEVENRWADRFTGVLAAAAAAGATAHSVGWYAGDGNVWDDPGGFASSVGGSLASTVASASTAPSSSGGGSSGGGSSGGGGGGGGGSGW